LRQAAAAKKQENRPLKKTKKAFYIALPLEEDRMQCMVHCALLVVCGPFQAPATHAQRTG
jgi:hypothetical protein